ncbi:hypothetical protein PV04_05827 [Phialophora macrospora]|uniref:Rhodopsin domain-containing protein n=1 Tax=Phialophora macrospora TaxID=1851006 RepID=A0A0D2CMR5_9EURO|nr:hypothetical protein PV04_05827 [Phialophora macrospora]
MAASLPPQTWPPPNYVDPERRGGPVLFITTCATTAVVVGLRLYSRLRLSKSVGLDDALLLAGFVISIGQTFAEFKALTTWGWNLHLWDVPIDRLQYVRLSAWLTELFFLLGNACTKISILLVYRKISARSHITWFIRLTWAAIALTVAYTVGLVLELVFVCRPLESYWKSYRLDYAGEYTCGNEQIPIVFSAAASVFSDVYASILPMLVVKNLNMTNRQRLSLYALFSAGLLTAGIGVARLVFLAKVTTNYRLGPNTHDVTWYGWPVFVGRPSQAGFTPGTTWGQDLLSSPAATTKNTMDQQPMSALTDCLRGLHVARQMRPATDGDIPALAAPIELLEDSWCDQCGGHGHWRATCDFLEHTKLSGRTLSSLSQSPDAELRFHLSLPWTALRCGSILRSNTSNLLTPNAIEHAICLLLDFTTHLADYAKLRWLQHRMLNNMWHWLQTFSIGQGSEANAVELADQINTSRHSSQILAAWRALAEESTRSLGELVANLVKVLKEFERTAIIMPIAARMIRSSQSTMPSFETNRQVLYSEIWEYVTSSQLEHILAIPLSQQAYNSLLTAVSSHRATYMLRQAELDRMFRESIITYQEVRRDPRFRIAFALPKVLAVQMDVAVVDALRGEDFAWPDRGCLLMRWCRAMDEPEHLATRRPELDISYLFDIMSI